MKKEEIKNIVISILLPLLIIWLIFRGIADVDYCNTKVDHTYWITYGCLKDLIIKEK
jgi:hypothetical protein